METFVSVDAPEEKIDGPVGVSVALRACALVIDSVILAAALWILRGLLDLASPDSYTAEARIALVLIFTAFVALYFTLFEWKLGATVGKRIMNLRVVNLSGGPITLGAAAARTVMRIIDGQFVYVVAAIAVVASKRHQRLGDMVARTLVIKK